MAWCAALFHAPFAPLSHTFPHFPTLYCRKRHPELQRTHWVTERDIQWHGIQPYEPDWSETSRLVAFTLTDHKGSGLYVAFNTSHQPRLLGLPRWSGLVWQQV